MTIGTVTPDMVSRFEVSVCIEADPCQHDCKIVLSDERERNASIDRVDIDSLIQAIASEKIVYDRSSREHFTDSSSSKWHADQILTQVFSATDEQERPEMTQKDMSCLGLYSGLEE